MALILNNKYYLTQYVQNTFKHAVFNVLMAFYILCLIPINLNL
jgi:hypothetical protein